MRWNNCRFRIASGKSRRNEAFTISRAASNISAPMMKRSSAERDMSRARTKRRISDAVSVTQTLLQQAIELQLARPMSQIIGIVSGCEEVLDVAELKLGVRILRPEQFRNNEVFFGYDKRREIENGDFLTPLKFDLPVFARLANDAIDFNHAFVVDEIEDRLLSDRLRDVLFAHIV